jgi:hypothetical protein
MSGPLVDTGLDCEIFVKDPVVDTERLDDELILLHPTTLAVKVLNETAVVLWEALGTFATAEELAGLLDEARPELSDGESLACVRTFLDELVAAGIVHRQERAQG